MTGAGQGEGEAIHTTSTSTSSMVVHFSLISNTHAGWNFLLVMLLIKRKGRQLECMRAVGIDCIIQNNF